MGSLKWSLVPTISGTDGTQVPEAAHIGSGVLATSGATAAIPAAPADFKGRRIVWALTATGADMWVRFGGGDAEVGKGHHLVQGQKQYLGARPGQAGAAIDDA